MMDCFLASRPARLRGQVWLGLALCGLVLTGCGSDRPETAPVSGKVTLGGQPLTKGKIVFFPEKGRSSMASIGADGSYELTTFEEGDGALPGKHKVTITAMESQGGPMPQSMEEEIEMGLSGKGGMAGPSEVKWIVPEKYSRRDTTPLEAEVTLDDDNVVNFDIPAGR